MADNGSCFLCNRRPKQAGDAFCHPCGVDFDRFYGKNGKKRRRRSNGNGHGPFWAAEVVVKWRGGVAAQVDGWTQRIHEDAAKLPEYVRTRTGPLRVIDLDVYQPNLCMEQVGRYKRLMRQVGAVQ